MPSYDSTARVPFASGGKVGSKKPKVKRIILWKGKAKDWPGAKRLLDKLEIEKLKVDGLLKRKKQTGLQKKKPKIMILLLQENG